MKRIILTSILAITAHSATADGMQPNEENFSSAMADIYFKEVLDRGGDNSFVHMRQVSSVENQNIIRENRDTLYSWGLFDVTDGLTITLPITLRSASAFKAFGTSSREYVLSM